MGDHRTLFNTKMAQTEETKGLSSTNLTEQQYRSIVLRLQELQQNPSERKCAKDYRLLNKYELNTVSLGPIEITRLIKKGSSPPQKFIVDSEMFDAIKDEHLASGHGGRDIVHKRTVTKIANCTKELIQLYIDLCEDCQLKKSKIRKGIVVKPIVSDAMNSRAQVDLIDMQSQADGPYNWILNYQDHLTKFVILRALTKKTALQVAAELVDIFCLFGAPLILQSDNGREFANKIVTKLVQLWPGCKIVHGKPRHSQSQGSVERANRDVEAILACWLKGNNTTE